jgi:hypothetical protein
LWALVLSYQNSVECVVLSADADYLYAQGVEWLREEYPDYIPDDDVDYDLDNSYQVVPVEIDWPSLDPQGVPQCVKSAV